MQAAPSHSTNVAPIWSHPQFAKNFHSRREAPAGEVVNFYAEKLRLEYGVEGRFQVRGAWLAQRAIEGRGV